MEKKIEEVIAQNLKYYMELKDIQQKQVADRLGVSASTVSYWIRGLQMPRTNKIDELCSMLMIEREQLLLPKEESDKAIIIREIADIAKTLDIEQLKMLLKLTKAMKEEEE